MNRRAIFLCLPLILLLIGGIYYGLNYGSINYAWKINLDDYREWRLIGNSTLNGYVKADGEISVYILTKDNLKKLKNGENFEYFKGWEHVKNVYFKDVRIPKGDYVLVVKNEEKDMQWISVKIINRK